MPAASAAPGALGVHDVGGVKSSLKDKDLDMPLDLKCPPLRYWEFQVPCYDQAPPFPCPAQHPETGQSLLLSSPS